jgi:pimeloyl-ACP methyl ester carboxylesterase
MDSPTNGLITDVLRIAYLDVGSTAGWTVVLLHGFPYDVLAYEEVA